MRHRHSKIVATIGPASTAPDMLQMLFETGVDVFRLNYSHANYELATKIVKTLRTIETKKKRPITIFADLQGPKIRTGKLHNNKLDLITGQPYLLIPESSSNNKNTIPIPHPEIMTALVQGDVLRLDDGKLQLTIIERQTDNLLARADTPGTLTNRKGINIPSRNLPISALTEKDRNDLNHALSLSVDYIALSFVQKPQDIEQARTLVGTRAKIIAKIEKPGAVAQLDEIIRQSDAIMVARGDLGVELPAEDVPAIQRNIVKKCRSKQIPVIVATHMLESMVDSTSPTRAEASDVASAIYQGADAVMLSAETAIGRHPPTAVAIMDRIIRRTEKDILNEYKPSAIELLENVTTADTITQSAAYIASVLKCRLTVAYTRTGSTAARLSRDRPHCPVIAATPTETVARQLALHWGIQPCVTEDISDFREMMVKADRLAKQNGAKPGDRIICIAGYPFGYPGKTNTLKISRVGTFEE